MRNKFHIEAELVLPSTVTRLQQNCRLGQSLFDLYPFTIVSTDFIKSDSRRDEFLRACPELVIVDEAHTCAEGECFNFCSRSFVYQFLGRKFSSSFFNYSRVTSSFTFWYLNICGFL
ncbi:hypothetical protein [Scytonema sp. UIC 10036]|uniref:hypothetical protein n=1 Tax=Scytonema sp. UIC 10036 TaxID=2304196 RepID=UPI001A9AA2C4|nr:hypothetical protein [Scytonema sp. UIC 10036]